MPRRRADRLFDTLRILCVLTDANPGCYHAPQWGRYPRSPRSTDGRSRPTLSPNLVPAEGRNPPNQVIRWESGEWQNPTRSRHSARNKEPS